MRDKTGQVTAVTNLPSPTTSGIIETTTIGGGSNRITGLTGTATKTYSYDANGNITTDGILTYTWDALNRLIKVEKAGSVVATYGYDSQNRRIRKTVGAKTIHYHYCKSNLLIGETLADGTPLRDYLYLNGEPLALREYETNPGTYYFLNDHLGTPQQLVKADGTMVWRAAYLPYGQAQVQLGTVTNNLRFPGQYFDSETGLHYNLNRYYDPTTGRYLSPDPIGLEGGMHLYAYVSGNPVNFVDPFGLATFMCTKPLHGLGDTWGPRLYPESKWNPSPTYHQFLCVKDGSGKLTCGGQDRTGSAAWSDGKPSDDKWPESGHGICEQQDETDCVDKCVIQNVNNPKRPRYGIGPQGTDCQEWADDVLKQCQKACKGKK